MLLNVIAVAAAVPVLMRLDMRRLQRLLEPSRPPAGATSDAIERVVRHVALARRVASPLVRPGCLTRGLTHYYFLRRAGLDVQLCFGMGEVGGAFTGHCWLTREGQPYLEATDPRPVYTQMFSIPSLTDSEGTPPSAHRLVHP
jgi:hypothetical protein